MHRPLALCVLTSLLPGQDQAIDPSGLPGTAVLGGGGRLPPEVYAAFLAAAGERAQVVVVPTATARCDTAAEQQAILDRWRRDHPGLAVTLLHTRDRATADSEAFAAPLRQATAVWFGGGAQERLAAAYLGTRVEREVAALLARGGAVGGTSAGTAIQTRTMIQEGRDPPVLAQGFAVVPGAIADQHFSERQRLPRLRQALAARPGHFGIGIDEGTAAIVRGRELRAVGRGRVHLVLGASADRAERITTLAAGATADLVTWQRAARDRAAAPFPPPRLPPPQVPSGALLLVGGGRLPAVAIDRFVALAGGAAAKVVLVPGAMPPGQPPEPFARLLAQRGVREIREFPARHPREVTAASLAVFEGATAVWFGGGRQWRLCDACDGTAAVAAIRGVLARGGVVGGTSAGATIQGEFLVRGNPLGNTEMWCEGYDRGFALLPGTAVDQHFLARQRTPDLQQLCATLPQLCGLGIDEGTALLVQGSVGEVLGDSQVAVFPPRPAGAPAATAPVWLRPGERWDFAAAARR